MTAASTTNTNTGGVERQHEEHEVAELADAVAADGERHGAERTEGRHTHDERHHSKHGRPGLVQALDQRAAAFAHTRQGHAEQDGEEQDGQDVAAGECVEYLVRDDVDQELGDGLLALGSMKRATTPAFRVLESALTPAPGATR